MVPPNRETRESSAYLILICKSRPRYAVLPPRPGGAASAAKMPFKLPILAALLECRQENVGQVQRIFVADDSHALLNEIRDDILRYANSLTHRDAQVIDAVDLSAIQRHFSSDALPD